MSSPSHLSTTKDGYRYDVARDQVTTGFQTEAVKSSSAHTEASYDVIIIGSGFTGLAAA